MKYYGCLGALLVLLFTAVCKEKKTAVIKTVLRDSHLVDDVEKKVPAIVPDSALTRGQFIEVIDTLELNGKKYDQVRLAESGSTGYVDQGRLAEGALEALYVLNDGDLFKSEALKDQLMLLQAGQKVLVLEQKASAVKVDIFIVNQSRNVLGYVKPANLGQHGHIVRKAVIGNLGLATVQASTEKDGDFDVRNLFDKKTDRAWCEGKANRVGIAESVSIIFDRWLRANKIRVYSGYKKFRRVKKLRLQGEEDSATIELANIDGWQEFEIELGSDAFALIIEEVHPGPTKTICLAEVELAGEFGESEEDADF